MTEGGPAPKPSEANPPPDDDTAAAVDLQAQLRDLALGELDAAERARLTAALAAQPASAEWSAREQRLAAALAAVEQHPQLGALQPNEAWRTQTLHKAKVEAARLRKQRQAQALPVARPPLTHRQLAGKTTQAVSADALDPFATGVATGVAGGLGGPATAPTGVRRLFLAVAVTAAAGVLLITFLAARVIHRWQVAPTAATVTVGDTRRPGQEGGKPAAQPLAPRELLLLKRDYPDLGQVLETTSDSVLFELGGAVAGPGWQQETAATVENGLQRLRCASPDGWDRIDLEGNLTAVTLVFVPATPQGLTIRLTPRTAGADGGDGGAPRAATGGWQLALLKQTTPVQEYVIPGPTGGAPRALAIERVSLKPGEEQLRFQAVASGVEATGPARAWEVLSERILPVPCAPGHWVIETPAGWQPQGLQYVLRARLARAKLAPETVPAPTAENR